MDEKNILNDSAAAVVPLSKDNISFAQKGGFLSAVFKSADGEKVYPRVFLYRAFPFEKLWEYISVYDEDSNEIGVISSIDNFDEKDRELLKVELERKYYQPVVKQVLSLKERYGFSYWTVITDEGSKVEFTMQDTFRNIIRIGNDKAVLLDVDGNRFVIESILGLDKKSYKRIELYL
jgi:hypothetical protein